jgi:hypothetical protein
MLAVANIRVCSRPSRIVNVAYIVFFASPSADVDAPVAEHFDDFVHNAVAKLQCSVECNLKQSYLIGPFDIGHNNNKAIVHIEFDV